MHSAQTCPENEGMGEGKCVHINRSLYFDTARMDGMVKVEFLPGIPRAYLSTAEQGISILVCRPHEMAHIRNKEQTVQVTAKTTPLLMLFCFGENGTSGHKYETIIN